VNDAHAIADEPLAAAVAEPPEPAAVVEPPEEPEPERVLLHMPVDVRSASLAVLAVLASLFVLHWAKEVFIPILLGVMFSYALEPIIARLERWRVPRALGSALLILAILGGIGWTARALSDDATALLESLPDAAQRLRESLQASPGKPAGAIEKVQKAATEIERAAEENAAASAVAKQGVTRVQVEKPKFDVRDWLWPSALGLAAATGQAVAVCFITYFLLAAGSTFRRKMVKIAGPSFTEKRVTVQALDEISAQIERYLLVQLVTSIMLGVATWLAFLALGMQHAAVWGVLAGVTNLVPYVGAIVVVVGSALVAFVQFGSIDQAVLIGGAALVIHTIIGYGITPWMTSRAGSMNPVVIFAGVLAWGWLWGVWGLLLGAPILMVVKSICDRVEDLKPVGELLAE
jgi:predicted PurR-regulated permease PerM